jgi:nicotinamide mononucleotide transporter
VADLAAVADAVSAALAATSWAEALAVVLAIAYLLLALRQDPRCWWAGGASSALFLWIFAASHVYLQAALQVVYIALAVYGWWQWRHGAAGGELPVTRWRLAAHAWALAGTVVVGLLAGLALGRYTDSPSPWLDALTTVTSLFATWLTARKVLESWLWWIGIDLLTGVLFWQQQLVLTALLFIAYTAIAIQGYVSWRRSAEG